MPPAPGGAGVTPAFMATEQALGKSNCDARVDIHTVGCLAFWFLPERLVSDGDTPLEVLVHRAKTAPPVPSSFPCPRWQALPLDSERSHDEMVSSARAHRRDYPALLPDPRAFRGAAIRFPPGPGDPAMKSSLVPSLAVAVFLAINFSPGAVAHAGWPHAPDETLPLATTSGFELARDVKPDGEGGMWVAWDVSTEGSEGPILQRIASDGEALLGPDGLRLSTAIGGVYRMDILPADDGGVFVAWEDSRSGTSFDIYMQRVTPTGQLLWDPAGVLVEAGPDVAVAVGNGGIISHSLDRGDTWTAVSSGTGQSLLGVSVASGRILAAGDNGTFLESNDQGASWTVLQTGGWPDLNALDLYSSGTGFAVGDDGLSWIWDGQQWSPGPVGSSTDFLGVSMAYYDVVTAVGRDGRIARLNSAGTAWVEQASGVGGHLHDVSFSSPDVGTAVGVGGVILRTVDGGATWVPQMSGTSQTLLAVDFFDDQIGVATGYAGTALWTDDGGATWTQGNTPVVLWYMGVDITDANTAVAVGQDRTIIKTVDGGASWTLQYGPSGTVDFWEVSAPGNVTQQIDPKLVADGSGGAFVLWRDLVSGDYQVMAQRIDAQGILSWPSAVQLTDALSGAGPYFAVPRGNGGAIVVWAETLVTQTVEILSQSIDLDGNLVYAQPQVVSNDPSAKYDLDMAADGRGGAIVGWRDNRAAPSRIYAMRLDESGLPRWQQSGQPVSVDESGGQYDPAVVADGRGGAFFIWRENRGSSTDIYAQRVDQHGDPGWPGGDVALCTTPGTQTRPFASPDGLGGFAVAWLDNRTLDYQLYAQAVTAEGALRWGPNGVPVREGAPGGIHGALSVMYIVQDGSGGALVVWGDSREGSTNSWDIYAQNVDRHGVLGMAQPSITSVVDVPQDQGGQATVSWDASYLDTFPNQVVTHYSVWRRGPSASKRATEAKARALEAALEAGLPADLVAA